MEKEYQAIEYANGYTELFDKEGSPIETNNSQIILEEKASSVEAFVKKVKAHVKSLGLDIVTLSIEIREVKILNHYLNP